MYHHISLGAGTLLVGLIVGVLRGSDLRTRVSMASAYAALAMMALALALGPLNLLRGRPNPVSQDLRRDAGIRAGMLALLHTAVGLTVHMRGRMLEYFILPGKLMPRFDTFGLANYSGAVATLLLIVLVGLSSDWALRTMGTVQWKRWQRSTYLVAGSLVLHGVLYQFLESRAVAFVIVFALVVVIVGALQFAGRRRYLAERIQRSRAVASTR